MKHERVDHLLSRLGYGSRKEIKSFIRQGIITNNHEKVRKSSEKVDPQKILFDNRNLEYPEGLTIILNKPVGYVCSHSVVDSVFELLPAQWEKRRPHLNTVGRLDKETSGLLIITDDGQLTHNIISPKKHVGKVYQVELEKPLNGSEVELFASGTLQLKGENHPCKPAELKIIDDTHCEVTLFEGKYHQVRRMFVTTENHVVSLHRSQIGGLTLSSIEIGKYEIIDIDEITSQIF